MANTDYVKFYRLNLQYYKVKDEKILLTPTNPSLFFIPEKLDRRWSLVFHQKNKENEVYYLQYTAYNPHRRRNTVCS